MRGLACTHVLIFAIMPIVIKFTKSKLIVTVRVMLQYMVGMVLHGTRVVVNWFYALCNRTIQIIQTQSRLHKWCFRSSFQIAWCPRLSIFTGVWAMMSWLGCVATSFGCLVLWISPAQVASWVNWFVVQIALSWWKVVCCGQLGLRLTLYCQQWSSRWVFHAYDSRIRPLTL